MQQATIDNLKEGMTIYLDRGFTCVPRPYASGPFYEPRETGRKFTKRTVLANDHGLYFDCNDGRHYLCGQLDDYGLYVGVFI